MNYRWRPIADDRAVTYALDLYAADTCIPAFAVTVSKIDSAGNDNRHPPSDASAGTSSHTQFDVSAVLLHAKFYETTRNQSLSDVIADMIAWVNTSLHPANGFAIEIVRRVTCEDIPTSIGQFLR